MSSITLPIESGTIGEKEFGDGQKNENISPYNNTPQLASGTTSISGGDTQIDNEKNLAKQLEEQPARNLHGIKWALVVISILWATFLFALDNTIVADVQPAIIETFGDISKLSWMAGAFLLGAASTNLIWGKIYSQFNAKWLYMICVTLFEAGSAICGAANETNAVIVGRAICGFGGIGMYIGVMTLLSVNTTVRERPIYLGLTGLAWGLGTVLGPIIGGAFAGSSATWRWAFYINLCIGGFFAPVYIFLLPSFDPRPGVPQLKRLREIDVIGSILILGAFLSLIMGINFGGLVYAWNSGSIIALFVVSGILFIIFGLQQVFTLFTTEENRIFPVQFVYSRTMVILFIQTAAASTASFVPIYIIPLFFQFADGDSALEAAVRLLPYIVFYVVSCIASGALMSKFGYYMPWYLGAGIFVVVGSALMITIDNVSSTAHVYGYAILLGIGSGSYCQASFAVAQGKVKMEDIPLAVGFITNAQVSGIAIALSTAEAIFLNESATRIHALFPALSMEQVNSMITGVGSTSVTMLPEATKEVVLQVIIFAISRTYILVLTAGCLTIVLSLFMKREKLFMTAAVAS